jgi:hypothetical protein
MQICGTCTAACYVMRKHYTWCTRKWECVRHCPMSEMYFVHRTFRDLHPVPS